MWAWMSMTMTTVVIHAQGPKNESQLTSGGCHIMRQLLVVNNHFMGKHSLMGHKVQTIQL
jgi:hypothetical protein